MKTMTTNYNLYLEFSLKVRKSLDLREKYLPLQLNIPFISFNLALPFGIVYLVHF